MPETSEVSDRPDSLKRGSRYRFALVVSVVFHIVLIATLLFLYVPTRQPEADSKSLAANGKNDGSKPDSPPAPPAVPQPIADPEVPRDQMEASIGLADRAVGKTLG